MSNEILYNSQVISFLEELWGDGFLSPGGSDEVKKVIEGIQIKDKRGTEACHNLERSSNASSSPAHDTNDKGFCRLS